MGYHTEEIAVSAGTLSAGATTPPLAKEATSVDMDAWDIGILVVAAYIAVMALVRLMSVHRRNETARLQKEIAAEQRRQRLEEIQQQQSGPRQGAA